MNYPVWELGPAGGGLLVAVIAVVHVYVAHFAIGGGLFLVLTEKKGYRENSQAILDYTKKHAKFFLLLTTVFGGITGVGIWFTISLLSPGATSTLVHTFVFGWATEWVCFVGEITAIFIYYYRFGKMTKKDHLTVGWIYFIFAWLSLFFVNGIIGFMLTPGQWLETGRFWDGFFNPTMWPSLFFRTALSLLFAGIFGFVTAVFIRDERVRETMIRYCAKWAIIPLLFVVPFAYWYFSALPEIPEAMVLGSSPDIIPFFKTFLWLVPVLFIGALFMAVRIPGGVKKPLAFVLLVIGLLYMGAFEWIRESARRPYLIYGHTYSTSVKTENEAAINQNGFLKTAKWTRNKEITENNVLDAGMELFRMQCACCHSVGGPMNDILPLTKKFTAVGMDAQLDGQGKINPYMPRFLGTVSERNALARFVVEELHGKTETPVVFQERSLPVDIPPFDEETDEYVLLAWSDFGVRTISDCDAWFTLRSPGNDIFALLVRRGETPEIVMAEEAVVAYHAEPETKIKGDMKFDVERSVFVAHAVPFLPYPDDGTFNPYPLVTITAKHVETGETLAQTKTVAPVSTEMGCKTCHGGEWREGVAGISNETARDILAVHDRINRTDLLGEASLGGPTRCDFCHADGLSKAGNASERLNLSAAIHGFHANYMTNRGAEACHACHPSSPSGNTRFFRGIHKEQGMDCVNCHSEMEDHALGLLAAEKQAGKKSADRLMTHLVTKHEPSGSIAPRKPWVNEPDCLDCHVGFQPPETDETNNRTKNTEALFRSRTDDVGIMCQACHGSTHAVYPASNIFGNGRDIIQPMQYQKNRFPIGSNKNCKLCHTKDMEDETHHPNMLGMFRNQ